MTKFSILLVSVLAFSCGDNLKPTTGDGGGSGSGSDAGGGFPAAPTLGVQIDRLGRPAINTVLNHGFDPTAAAGSAKDAYNQDGSPGGWQQAYTAQFAGNLAVLDTLDTGLVCVTGTCSPRVPTTAGDGCGNQVLYNDGVAGPPTPTSYITLAGLLAADELFLDTRKTTCDLGAPGHQNYLGVEFNVVTGLTNSCGGRDPLNDVIDTSFTVLAVGIQGFATDFTPVFKDNVGPHADVHDDTFPFLGAPH